MEAYHEPVLVAEVLELLVRGPGVYVDGTLGGGGHAFSVLSELQRLGKVGDSLLIGIDRDNHALQAARRKLLPFGDRAVVVKGNFSQIATIVQEVCSARNLEASVEGVLLDLGVSSAQIDTPHRGFSYLRDGPLDMRMDPKGSTTAADLVNTLEERELRALFVRYGQEQKSGAVARDIVAYRERHGLFSTTGELAAVVRKSEARPQRVIKRLSRIFQALRIEVNRELEALERVLACGVACLSREGRFAVISYHSLEDRMVKSFFAERSRSDWGPKGVGLREPLREAECRVVTKKPVVAGRQELSLNPRARSAKLRVLEKQA